MPETAWRGPWQGRSGPQALGLRAHSYQYKRRYKLHRTCTGFGMELPLHNYTHQPFGQFWRKDGLRWLSHSRGKARSAMRSPSGACSFPWQPGVGVFGAPNETAILRKYARHCRAMVGA